MIEFIPRSIEGGIRRALERGKSVLLLGARQTGKTTLILEHIYCQLVSPQLKLQYWKEVAGFEIDYVI